MPKHNSPPNSGERQPWRSGNRIRTSATALLAAGAFVLTACGGDSEPVEAAPAPGTSAATTAPTQSSPPEQASPASPYNTLVGIDISFPQCSGENAIPLPESAGFAILGVNGMYPTEFNPCLRSQIDWAMNTLQDPASLSFYVTSANPAGEPGITTWPTNGTNAYGTCRGERENLACAYEYGVDRASADITTLSTAAQAVIGNWSPVDKTVYIDVETEYSWAGMPDTPNLIESPRQSNIATLAGMVDTLHAAKMKTGVYTNSDAWMRIVGQTPPTSSLHGLKLWISTRPVAANLEEGIRNCGLPNFIGDGQVAIAQFLPGGLDQNVACRKPE